MKSKLFSVMDLSDETTKSFTEDIKEVFEIDEEALIELVRSYPNYIKIQKSSESKKLLNEFEKKYEIKISTIQALFNIFGFFFKNFEQVYFSDDTSQSLAEDLINLEILNQSNKQKFIKIINILKSELFDDIKKQFAENRTRRGVLPSYQNIFTSVELRAILKNDFEDDQKSTDFEPEIIGLVPIISVALSNDSTENSQFNFQATIEDTEDILEKLKAAIKVANQLKDQR